MKRTYKPIKLIASFALAISFFSTTAFAQVGENDSTFNTPDNGPANWYKSANSWVRVTAAQADNNKFVLGGEFTTYNGESHNRIVRILANGSIDPSFNSGTGLNGTPSSIAVQADNKIIVGGSFTSYNGSTVNGFIRLNENGSLDNSFPAASVLSNVKKIKVQSSGKFFALTNLGLARLNADGTIDGTFANTGYYGGEDYAVQPDGKVIIATDETDSLHLFRLLANGSLDPTYKSDLAVQPNETVTPSFPGINSIALQLDGKVIIGGFYRVPNSQEIGILRRVNTDGTEDSTFVVDHFGTWGIGVIYSINVQPNDGKIIVAGHYDRAPGGLEHTYVQFIARLNLNGSTDGSFIHNNKYVRDAYVIYSATLLNNGKVLVGGFFEEINAYTAKNVALLNSDGELDSDFNAIASANGTILSSAIQADQKILIGGLFSSVHYTSRNHVARLLSDGELDTSFNPGKGTNGPVYAIANQTDGKAIIGGDFTRYDTDTVHNIVRVNTDGSIDHSFEAAIEGTVYSIKLQSDNKVIVGGFFSSVNGEPRFDIVRLNADGSIDTNFEHVFPVAETNRDEVHTSLIAPNGQIYIGGNFSVSNKDNIVRLNADGTIDATFTHTYGINFNDLARQPDGKIIAIGGEKDNWSNFGTGFIIRLNIDGSLDTTWTLTSGPGIGYVSSVTLLSNGSVLVGGEFPYLPNASAYLALLDSLGNGDTTFVGNIDGPVYTTQAVANDKVVIGGAFHQYTDFVRNNIARICAPTDIPNGIKKYAVTSSFIVYPNPATNIINAADLKQGSSITIRNITGAVIYSEQVTGNRSSINVSNFANGIYFMTQSNKEGISTQRFVVNK